MSCSPVFWGWSKSLRKLNRSLVRGFRPDGRRVREASAGILEKMLFATRIECGLVDEKLKTSCSRKIDKDPDFTGIRI